jgi:disulfide bond formation protein DsbB
MSIILPLEQNFNSKFFHLLVILLSIAALTLAYIAEYLFAFTPCALCVYARIPYVLLLFLAIIGYFGNIQIKSYYLLVITSAISLGAYHIAIEHSWLELSALCQPMIKFPKAISLQDFAAIISMQKMPACNAPSIKFLSLSMTEWNLLSNFILLFSCLFFMKSSK